LSRFRGSFEYSVDEKGRINVPAKFRRCLNPAADDTFVVSRGPEGCLRAYPQDIWNSYEDKLNAQPQTKENVQKLRILYRSVSDSKLDGQGRVTLSPLQLKIAGITKNVTLVGNSQFIEIWDSERYNSVVGEDEAFDELFYNSPVSSGDE